MEELDLDLEDLLLVYTALMYFDGSAVLNDDKRERLWELIEMFGSSITLLKTEGGN